MRMLVVADAVVTNAEPALLRDAALVIEDGRVREVGPREQLEGRGPFDRRLGGPGYVALPGFVNAHYHSECWTTQGLIGTIFEVTNLFLGTGSPVVDEEVLELLATWALVQAAKGGQTTLVDVYYGKPQMALLAAEPVLRAYERVGLRVALGLALRDQNTYAHEEDERFLARVAPALAEEVRRSPLGYAWPLDLVFDTHRRLLERWEGRGGRTHLMLAPDWTPACSDELLRRTRRVADESGSGITMHVLETRSEMMWNQLTHGGSTVRRLLDLGVLGEDVTFDHFVWASDEDIAIVADTGVNVATCPGSNLRLSSGICRVRDLLAAGASVAVGTDGISFSDREDFFQELRLASYLQRQPDVFAEHRLDSTTLLRSVGRAGARAAGFPGRIGVLEPGAEADLVLLRGDWLFPPGRYDQVPLLDVLVDRANGDDVDTVMVGGEVIVQGGRMVSLDEERLRQRIAELADHLYHTHPSSLRWRELATALLPHAQSLYEEWYSVPVEPASVYNLRRTPSNRAGRAGGTPG